MKRSKPGAKYQGLAFAVPFIQEIKEHIKDDSKYRSVTDFVRQATREKMNIDIGAESLRKVREQDYKERYDKAFFEKHGITPEEDNKPGDFSFKSVDIPSGKPTIEELEVKLNKIKKEIKKDMITKDDLKQFIAEMNKPKVKDKKTKKNGFRG